MRVQRPSALTLILIAQITAIGRLWRGDGVSELKRRVPSINGLWL